MSGKHQGLRYFQKFLNSKASERNALAKKVLRCVLAVGFVLSPWLGGEAYAAETGSNPPPGNITLASDTNTNLMVNKVAHIYAQNVDTDGKVGFNHFTTFKVENGEIANLYFQKDSKSPTLNALVNTVDTQISISGVVNGIRNNTIGGKLYFLSPKGMIVGSTGVINAGALTIVAPESINGINDANAAASKVVNNVNWGRLAEDDTKVTINGKINTATGIDIQAMTVEIKKAEGSTIIPTLLTGVVFEKAVNSGFSALPISNNRLQLKKDQKGNLILDAADDVSVADPSNQAGSDDLNGNGIINIYSRKDLGSNEIGGITSISEAVLNAIGKVGIESGTAIEIDKSITGDNTNRTSITAGYQIRLLAERSDFYNYGTISGAGAISLEAGRGYTANIINGGTIQSTDVDTSKSTATGTTTSTSGGIGITAHNSVTNEGTISASSQIIFSVPDSLTNTGTINSTGNNVHVHIGRDFMNNAVYGTDSSGKTVLTGGIITAGGNVQVDHTLPSGMTAVSTGSAPDGIFNSGLIEANGNVDPTYDAEGNIVSSGSGNIWLRSSYNITNKGTMMAGRQITLNARDFLHNYGLIEGVTYLDIKSIMGYVYNHASGVIRATGGNIDLSSGQANLVIDGDTNGTKKELYRKFTPIIIEGSVEATSALNNTISETNQGNINIRAYLGDIYVNGATIETKPELGTNGEVKAVAGNVILDAAQNITIGFKTEQAKADDPTTQAGLNGENKDKYERGDEREYYKPKVDTSGKFVNGTAANISGTNITLTSGSGANTISMSAVNNLTASDAVNFETAEMDFAGGTITANKISASGQLNVTGGSLSSTSGGSLTISGAEGLTLGAGAGISTDKDLTITSEKGSILNNAVLMSNNGSLTMSGAGSVNAGTVTGKDVVLSSGGGSGITADKIIVDTSLQLQGNDIAVTEIDRSNNPDVLKVDVFGAGGASSAVKGDLQLNIAGDVLFNTLNVNTAEVNVSGDLQIKQLHVADQAHFTSNNTMIGVYGEATEPRGDQSDALYRDMGNGSDSWMGINIKSDGYQITNGTEIQNAFAGGTEDLVQMSSKLVDVDLQETLVENYGDVTGNFGRFDLVDDSARPSGGIESTDQGSQTVLKQDENGLHIETSDNKVDNGPQIEAGDNKGDQGSQIEASDNKGDQGSQIEASDNKGDQGSQIEAGDDKENEDSQIEAGDKKKDKSKRDKKDKREKQKKDK